MSSPWTEERRRRRGATAVMLASMLVYVGLSLPAAFARGSETYRDLFNAVSYGGDDGSLNWSGPWIESGEADGPTAGRARVDDDAEDHCAAGACGYLNAGGNSVVGLERGADLATASGATLSFKFSRIEAPNEPALARVSVSADGGGSWATLATFSLDTTDESVASRSFDIASHATATTRVRFRVESSPGQSGEFYFDDVAIVVEFPDPTTTTTTSTTTTITPPSTTTSTTTTSLPPPTTSTTSTTAPPGPPSTTTSAPSSTTTTSAPTTTQPATTQPATTTTIPVTAAPPTTNGPLTSPPPFPVTGMTSPTLMLPAPDLTRRSPEVGADVSSLVRLSMGELFVAAAGSEPAALRERAAGEHSLGGAAGYLWPVVLPTIGIGVAAVFSNRVGAGRRPHRPK